MGVNWNHLPHCPVNIAHRGARAHAPENTLAAAALALRAGAHAWELDTALTRDNELVVMHDDTLVRTTDVASIPCFASRNPFRVCDFTLEELRGLNAGIFFLNEDPFQQIAQGQISASDLAAYRHLSIPTLEEALLFTRQHNWAVNVEIKDHRNLRGHTEITRSVVNLVRRLDMVERVLLSSFQYRYLLEAKRILPELATGVLAERARPQNPLRLCRILGANAYHPDFRILAEGDAALLRDAGLGVNVWTVGPADVAPLLAQGVSGIITDYPAACAPLLEPEALIRTVSA